MLLLSWAYVGCAVRPPVVPTPAPEPDRGGVLRVHEAAEGLLRAAVAAPLTPEGLARSPAVRAGAPNGGVCWAFRLDPGARFPDGAPVSADDVIRVWETGLRDPALAHRWLLAPVVGAADVVAGIVDHAAGLSGGGDELTICFAEPVPDLALRLRHRDLWVWRTTDGRHEGPGPFAETEPGVLRANPYYRGRTPYLDSIERVARLSYLIRCRAFLAQFVRGSNCGLSCNTLQCLDMC